MTPFDETQHPRGGAANPGQFTDKPVVAQSRRCGSRPAGPGDASGSTVQRRLCRRPDRVLRAVRRAAPQPGGHHHPGTNKAEFAVVGSPRSVALYSDDDETVGMNLNTGDGVSPSMQMSGMAWRHPRAACRRPTGSTPSSLPDSTTAIPPCHRRTPGSGSHDPR